MRVSFADPALDRLETDPHAQHRFPPPVVKAYRKRLWFIRAAHDERDLRQMKGANLEKLSGNRKHQHSMRLNDQWRLIFEIHGEAPHKVIAIVAIEDYH